MLPTRSRISTRIVTIEGEDRVSHNAVCGMRGINRGTRRVDPRLPIPFTKKLTSSMFVRIHR